MGRKTYSPENIVRKLWEAEVLYQPRRNLQEQKMQIVEEDIKFQKKE